MSDLVKKSKNLKNHDFKISIFELQLYEWTTVLYLEFV